MYCDENDIAKLQKRIQQRKAFNSVWKRLIAIHQLDDCMVDEFLNAIEKV
jgi:hypothetical protein